MIASDVRDRVPRIRRKGCDREPGCGGVKLGKRLSLHPTEPTNTVKQLFVYLVFVRSGHAGPESLHSRVLPSRYVGHIDRCGDKVTAACQLRSCSPPLRIVLRVGKKIKEIGDIRSKVGTANLIGLQASRYNIIGKQSGGWSLREHQPQTVVL